MGSEMCIRDSAREGGSGQGGLQRDDSGALRALARSLRLRLPRGDGAGRPPVSRHGVEHKLQPSFLCPVADSPIRRTRTQDLVVASAKIKTSSPALGKAPQRQGSGRWKLSGSVK